MDAIPINKAQKGLGFRVRIRVRVRVRVRFSVSVTGRWVCDDRFYGLVNRSNR